MKIVVPVKQAAALADEFEFREDHRDVEPSDLEWSLNEWDAFSLEEALTLREQAGDGEVVVVSVGEEESEEGLRECLAKGADRAIRIWDEALAEADPLVIAHLLAAAARREEPDLLLCGVQSSDAASSSTGIALARLLDLPRVAIVRAISLEGDALLVERELAGGSAEQLRVPLPAALTVQTGINQPRYATLRAIKQAAEKPLELLAPADLGFEGGQLPGLAGFRVRRMDRPPRTGGAEMLGEEPAEVAGRIAAIVRERVS